MKKMRWWLSLLILLPFVLFFAINAFDEKLDPKAAAWGEPRATTVPEAENGYYALIAMGASDGGDGPAYARAWVAEARAAATQKRNEKQAAVTRAKRPDVCNPALASCLAAAREKGAELATALEAHKEDIARYRTLIATSRFEEVLDYPMRVNAGLPPYGDAMRAQRAWLTQAALAAEAGNLDDALSAVEQDIAFYRVMLGGARTLIGKMTASRGYWNDLAFVADLLQQKAAALEPSLPRLRAMLKGIDPAALRMDGPMEGEFGVMKRIFRDPASAAADVPHESGWLERIGIRLIHKPNATINLQYRNFAAMTQALNQPPAAIEAAFRKASQPVTEMGMWDYIDNPIGKMLLSIAVPALHQYALRLHDLDAFNRLVALRMEALAANISTDQAAEFAAKSEARLHDPYSGKPMAWDAEKNRFYFKPRGVNAQQNKFNVDATSAFVTY